MSYYSSRFTQGGVSYFSGFGGSSGSSSRNRYGIRNTRNRNIPGTPRLDINELYFKYRHYAPKDCDPKNAGPQTLSLDLNKEANRLEHRTNKYDDENLIVRRGQEFKVDLTIKVPFDKERDAIQLLFAKGKKAMETKGTMVRVDVCRSKKEADAAGRSTDWKGYISSINGSGTGAVVSVVIIPSVTALIGKYNITSKVYGRGLAEDKKRFIKEEKDELLIVLFNAWCKDDQVYMDDEQQREEYVMRETGRIWVGSSNRNNGRPWSFGQFQERCLDAALYLLEESYLNDQSHGNATQVARALSAMANSNDNDKGVLTGNWSGNYAGGTSPTAWNGSIKILSEYMLTKRDVKYGQCWVYSGVLTTLGRAIGIPTRSVTNFESAHDSDNSLSIDTCYGSDGKPLNYLNDSVWNFHVWNEAWFKRPDLPDGHDGWQAFDATPQELSEGTMRCGPASVQAIKEGNVYLGYDARFIFAEVNGDRVTWLVDDAGEMTPISVKSAAVGKCISTKAVGSSLRNDITLEYKYAEGSDMERKAVARANKYSSKSEELSKIYDKNTKQDVDFKYESPVSRNGDIHIKVTATNKSQEVRHIKMNFASRAVYYTGVVGMDVDEKETEMELQAGEARECTFDLESKDYLNIIDEDAKIKEFVTCSVKETNQFFQEEETFHIDKPELEMKVSNKRPRVGQQIEVNLSFENPLDLTLTQAVIMIEGPGIQRTKQVNLHRNIKPREQVNEKVTLTPQFAGKREIIACFNSRQLVEVVGAVEVETVQ